MPLNYSPEDAVTCWPEGDYDAVLKAVEDKTSKRKPDGTGGNPMQVWTWEAYDNSNRTQLISDYVVIPAATFKIKQLARALGREDDFKAGKFQADDYIGETVTVELTIEQQAGYDDKNKVAKVKAAAVPPPSPAPPQRRPAQPQPPGRERLANRPSPSQRPTVADAVAGGAAEFKEDDIPFAWEGRQQQQV